MALSLKESQTLSDMSQFLYEFLPGQPHPFADQSISFAGIARDLGLSKFWQGGSKLPAINSLLERTLDSHRELFCSLILEIVRRSIKYRRSKGNPITKENIQNLNELIKEVGFKIPELWDSVFLDKLPKITPIQQQRRSQPAIDQLQDLKNRFLSFDSLTPQQRGFEFERFLTGLFALYDLQPRSSFRLVGEQIDGSLEFENHTYLIEAKYQSKPIGQSDLLIVKGRVEGTATWSRGLVISVSGFTPDGLEAFSTGRATNLICISGQDLYFILDNKMTLPDVLRRKARRAAETGEIMVSVQQLLLEL